MKNFATLLASLALTIAVSACSDAPKPDGENTFNGKPQNISVKFEMGPEHVIVRGIRPEEKLWGAYQFPRPYDLGDRLVVGVHIANDDINSFGITNRWFESRDKGATWREIDPKVATECGLKLPNGDKIYFPMENGTDVSHYKITPQAYRTPAYDFSKRAEEGTLPIPDGMVFWGGKTLGFNADRLPPSLSEKKWLMMRTPAGKTAPVKEYAAVDWPYLTRVVHEMGGKRILKPIFPRGNIRLGPDGAVWITAFSGEGHINPANGQYSPYYSAEIFRSTDNGKSFKQVSHMEYEADGKTYPYLSGRFSDSDIEFMRDGSIVWFMRSNWYAHTGEEWSPMYYARSTDNGKTWTKPEKFSELGTLPRLCRLKNGITLVCYARPGMFIRAALNDAGTKWSEPFEVMTPTDRSKLANIVKTPPTFHDWDGSCNNPEIVPVDDGSVLIFYSDFYYPDENGIKRKTILCRKITVKPIAK